MKTATFPSLRVDSKLRQAAEAVLAEGESLSGFIEQSIRTLVERRQLQSEFMARGLASRDEARRSTADVSSADVLNGLESRLDQARAHASCG